MLPVYDKQLTATTSFDTCSIGNNFTNNMNNETNYNITKDYNAK